MSSSRNDIDEALTSDKLGLLSEMMDSKEKPRSKREEELRPDAGNEAAGNEVDVDNGPSEDKRRFEAADAENGQQEERSPKIGTPEPSQKNPGQRPVAHPSKSDLKPPTAERSKKRHRTAERPTFTIGADQMATLRVLGSSKRDPLGSSASEIARRLFDLFGYNGRHPVAALHGQALSDTASTPGPLIEKRQWEDLLAKADEMVASLANPPEESLAEGSLDGESLDETPLDEGEARLACVCYLVQEALYEAGFGDRRRRRKDPF
jgi:hypothetical protein